MTQQSTTWRLSSGLTFSAVTVFVLAAAVAGRLSLRMPSGERFVSVKRLPLSEANAVIRGGEPVVITDLVTPDYL